MSYTSHQSILWTISQPKWWKTVASSVCLKIFKNKIIFFMTQWTSRSTWMVIHFRVRQLWNFIINRVQVCVLFLKTRPYSKWSIWILWGFYITCLSASQWESFGKVLSDVDDIQYMISPPLVPIPHPPSFRGSSNYPAKAIIQNLTL